MEVKQLMNVNESALPKAIRREFNKIYLEFRGGHNDTCTIIKPYSFLTNEQRKGQLFENEINEEVFVLLSDEKFTEYWEAYHKGFKKGYSEFDGFLTNLPFNDSDNKTRINRVFNGICNKFNRLHPLSIQIENNGYLIIKSHLQEFGFEVGTFIKCWDIILNNHNLFEEIFDLHYIKKEVIKVVNSEPEPLDLSNTKAVEKIIYLNELGIIDFLKTKPEFTTSTNLIATFLSAITDEKASTLQTSLNRLINNDTEDKNHPYKSKNTVNKILQTLINKNIKPKTS